MVRVGGERLLVPELRVLVAAELAAGVTDEIGDLGIVVVVQRPHGGDAGLVLAFLDQRARLVVALAQLLLRSEEHTSELQSLRHLVCRLLLEKKKNNKINTITRPVKWTIDQLYMTIYPKCQCLAWRVGQSISTPRLPRTTPLDMPDLTLGVRG